MYIFKNLLLFFRVSFGSFDKKPAGFLSKENENIFCYWGP